MTFKVGQLTTYNIKSETQLQQYADKILDSVYQLAEK
jgi:hypothetical protein